MDDHLSMKESNRSLVSKTRESLCQTHGLAGQQNAVTIEEDIELSNENIIFYPNHLKISIKSSMACGVMQSLTVLPMGTWHLPSHAMKCSPSLFRSIILLLKVLLTLVSCTSDSLVHEHAID